jgi:hypothetical protein
MHLYNRPQIKMLTDLSKAGSLDIFFDATGSIVRTMENQHRCLLYSVVVKPEDSLPPISLADLVTTDHSVPALNHFLASMVRYCMLLNRHTLSPRKVEIDWSWSLIQCSLQTFNHQTVKGYLNLAWRIHQSELREEDLTKLTVVHICTAHMMHGLVRTLRDLKNRDLKQFMLKSFGAIANTSNLDQASEVFRDIATVLNAQTMTPTVVDSLERIMSEDRIYDDSTEENQSELLNLEGDPFLESGSIKASSPFTAHFERIAEGQGYKRSEAQDWGP